jgi:hypothetical protein
MASAIPLVQSGLGSAILDCFTIGNTTPPGTRVIPLTSDIRIPLIAIYDAAEGLSGAAQRFLNHVACQAQLAMTGH